ncbi:somatostatin receptor type 5-like [Haliotis asinina]|uniref:somatostatin receptor type 5-like n=1 Tax=Haliotis asinina TaxID=109174 RepID=UPI003531B998
MDSVYYLKALPYILITLCILGITGNAISVCVLARMKSKPLRLLQYLNVVDVVLLVTICTIVTLDVLDMKGLIISALDPYYVIRCGIILMNVIQTFEAYLTVLIAFVRCMAVAMPFRFATCMRDSVQNKLLIATAVFSVLFNVPFILMNLLFLYEMSPSFSISILYIIFKQICCRILPILVIVICNIILAVSRCRMKSLPQANQCGSPPSRNSRSAFQLTCLVITITTMFVGTHGCLLVYDISVVAANVLESAVPGLDFCMIIINSATNFIFYCLIGSEFRTTLVSLCKKTQCFTRSNRSLSCRQRNNFAVPLETAL